METFLSTDWTIADVKKWILSVFPNGGEAIAAKFVEEEVDGKTLLSPTMQTATACEKLGINTLGKQEKFISKVKELNNRSGMIKNH